MFTEAKPAVPVRQALDGATMGTRWTAVFFAGPQLAVAPIQAGLQQAVDLVDAQMSTWKPDSDLMRCNRAPVGIWVEIPEQLGAVLALGLQIGRDSGGAFDVGVGRTVAAWGFGAAAADGAVNEAAARPTGQDSTELNGNRLRRLADVQLDLSGIAKGHGVDRLGKALEEHGILDYLVGIDGELRARGVKPDGTGWVVGLERPDRTQRALAHSIVASDMAIATSGDYRQWRDRGGTIVSHTMDPRSGRPVQNGVAAVTVTAEYCAVADAWATALMVLGPKAGPAMAQTLGLDALFTLHRDGGLIEIGVGGFAALAG